MCFAIFFPEARSIECLQDVRKGSGVVKECPCFSIKDRFQCSSFSVCDDGGAAGHGFQWDEAEVLVAWEDGCDGSSKEIVEFMFRYETEEGDRRPRAPLESVVGRSFAGDVEARPDVVAGIDRAFDALVCGELGDDEKVVTGTLDLGPWIDGEPVFIEWWVYDCAFAAPIEIYAALDGFGCGDEPIWSVCALGVPCPELVEDATEICAAEGTEDSASGALEDIVRPVPQVAGGRMDIAEMLRFSIGDDAVDEGRGAGDHEVVLRSVTLSVVEGP